MFGPETEACSQSIWTNVANFGCQTGRMPLGGQWSCYGIDRVCVCVWAFCCICTGGFNFGATFVSGRGSTGYGREFTDARSFMGNFVDRHFDLKLVDEALRSHRV